MRKVFSIRSFLSKINLPVLANRGLAELSLLRDKHGDRPFGSCSGD
jgi:hypothetical protein